MPLGPRTGVRSVSILALILGAIAFAPAGAAVTVPARPDTSARGSADSLPARDPGPAQDSVKHRPAKDSAKVRPVYRWESTLPGAQACGTGAESALDCWRRDPDLANQEIGFAGPRSWSLSLTHWRPLPQESPYFPFWKDSPYRSGGLLPPDRFAVKKLGGDAYALEEEWVPVAPLDTPVTRLDWMRGALTLNVFDFKLERMLSDRVYLGLDYYSASADSVTYDYQFTVHQPYLGGWGVLGKIYAPIDRDSASLVLAGTSHSIHALEMRPRVGYWIDSNRVVEFFLDQTHNGTSLTFPTGPAHSSASLIPNGPDSTQALMPSSLQALTEGVIYGERRSAWTAQLELSHGSAELSEYRKPADSIGTNRDLLTGDLFRAKGTLAATGIFARPTVTAEARSAEWQGDPVLAAAGRVGDHGWTDAQDIDAEAHPRWSFLELGGQAGLGRDSRMGDQVYWLPRYGASARLSAPLGFAAQASLSSRMEDPDWETLYRSNPARFRFANPDLDPRTDKAYGASVSWGVGRWSLEAGLDRMAGESVWLPRVLPGPGACADLARGLYAPLAATLDAAGTVCSDTAAGKTGALPDSLALALRNYDREKIDAWHLGLGMGLGHWTLALQNRFVFNRAVDDGDLRGTTLDLSVPERVFKGRLQWKRALLDDKLKLDFAWDWEWFSTRYAWAPDLGGTSRPVKLDEYLALDFAAAMKIKTFTLFFKTRNFNHDRYATEPGVHPPGVNFRFGVDWTLFD